MLIQETKHIGELNSYRELDEALDLPDGQSLRYDQYPIGAKTRAPQAASIQELENRVAKFLKRRAHKVIVENNRTRQDMGTPTDAVDLREFSSIDFQLGYEGDWPTYRRLITSEPDLIELYCWQWGVLWDRGLPGLSRIEWGIPSDTPIEPFIRSLTADKMEDRARVEASLGEGFRWGEAPTVAPSEISLEWNFANSKEYVQRVGGDVEQFWFQATKGTARTFAEAGVQFEFSSEM